MIQRSICCLCLLINAVLSFSIQNSFSLSPSCGRRQPSWGWSESKSSLNVVKRNANKNNNREYDPEIIRGAQELKKMEKIKAQKSLRKSTQHRSPTVQPFLHANSHSHSDSSYHEDHSNSPHGPSHTSRSSLDSSSTSTSTPLPSHSSKSPKSFVKQTIWGQNIVTCRSFHTDAAKTFSFMGSFKALTSLPLFPLPEIAFMGRSNVGKSSLLNCLTGIKKKVAVESKLPGCTRSMNVFRCGDGVGDICTFVDLRESMQYSTVQSNAMHGFLLMFLVCCLMFVYCSHVWLILCDLLSDLISYLAFFM